MHSKPQQNLYKLCEFQLIFNYRCFIEFYLLIAYKKIDLFVFLYKNIFFFSNGRIFKKEISLKFLRNFFLCE